jgi:hypothetical protein
MRKSVAVLVSAWALFGAAGCIDTWAGYGREERNLKNELADYMTRIVDEETAQEVVEGPAEKIKQKWESHKTRKANFVKAQDLGRVESLLQTLKTSTTAEMGAGQSIRKFTKAADDSVTMEGPALDGSTKETLDTVFDRGYQKAMEAADKRVEAQRARIMRIAPAGPFLQKAQALGLK